MVAEFAAENPDPDLRASSSRGHVDSVADGLRPDVRPPACAAFHQDVASSSPFDSECLDWNYTRPDAPDRPRQICGENRFSSFQTVPESDFFPPLVHN